jgi:hypothetical protein
MISGGNCQEVGVLYNIGSRLQQSEPQTSMLRLQHLGSDCELTTGTATATYYTGGDVSRRDPIVIDDWPFFLSATPRYLHTGILPEMIVDIVLAPNAVLGSAGATYTLDNIYFTIEVIQFDNDLYSKILETRLANGDTIEIPFMDAHYIIKPASNIIETQVSSNAINKLFVIPRATNSATTQANPVNGLTKPFIFTAVSSGTAGVFRNIAKTAYWSIDNKMYPQQPATVPELYQMTLDAFGDRASTSAANSLLLEPKLLTPTLLKADNTAIASFFVAGTSGGAITTEVKLPPMTVYKYIDPIENYLTRNCIFCLNLEINEGADQRLISGYSSVGKNAVIRFDASNFLGVDVDLTMFVLVKRCLKVRAGQQIFLEM